MSKTAGIIIIGNEVLSGKTQDINSTFLCRELRHLGVDVRRIIVIPDDRRLIGSTAAAFSADWDYVFTTGGVGPTHDDVTVEGVAEGFGTRAVIHPHLEKRLHDRYGDNLNSARLRMALTPEGSELLAQGSMFAPVIKYRNIYLFPGIPRILQERFAAIKDRFREEPFFLKNIYVAEGEGVIASTLNDLLDVFPDILLGSYPALENPEFKVKVTVESKNQEYLMRATEWLLARLPSGGVVRVESIP